MRRASITFMLSLTYTRASEHASAIASTVLCASFPTPDNNCTPPVYQTRLKITTGERMRVRHAALSRTNQYALMCIGRGTQVTREFRVTCCVAFVIRPHSKRPLMLTAGFVNAVNLLTGAFWYHSSLQREDRLGQRSCSKQSAEQTKKCPHVLEDKPRKLSKVQLARKLRTGAASKSA
eukprot:456345-Pelagomonas_calceolata.AAC.1